MKFSKTFPADKCLKETDYFVLFLMSLFFIAGYLLFKRKPNIISPILKRKLQFQKDKDFLSEQFEENQEEMNFFLDE